MVALMDTGAIRDLDDALRITGGSRELADELFVQFLDELPAQIAEVEVFLAENARADLRNLLHQIRGGASVCAVKPFIQALDDLHQHIKSGGNRKEAFVCMTALRQRTDELLQLHDSVYRDVSSVPR